MSRILAALWALGILLIGVPLASAQDSIALREIRELRQLLDQQSKQLQTLTDQVARLNQTLESQKSAADLAARGVPAPPPAPPEPAPPTPLPGADIPKAEAVSSGNKHVVAKGETLTAIAKQHNVGIAELQKANKIENDRKLQIGQTLSIPAPKAPETAPEKKPNP